MSTPTIFLFVGIIVLALAMIAMVVWVTMLSNRVKRLSDQVVSGAGVQRPAQNNIVPPHTADQAISPGVSRQAQQQTQQFAPQSAAPAPSYQVTQPIAMNGGASRQPQASRVQGAGMVRPLQATAGRSRVNVIQPMEEFDDGQAFFDNYRSQSEASQQATGSFGREKPVIPFGADKNEEMKRAGYTRDAVEEDYDPDSIDFSRVAGYKSLLGGH